MNFHPHPANHKSRTMSSHHGHHRSSHHSRSRMHHSSSHYRSISNRSRNQISNNGNNGGSSSTTRTSQIQASENRDSTGSEWTEHRSSNNKVYYYNSKTGVSQWEPPAELRQQRPTSPESGLSESSSIRQQQDKSPSSSASSANSAQSESVSEDKPLLTPGLAQYYRPELIVDFNSSHIEELERQANHCAREALLLNEKILRESVELKIAKSIVHCVDISLEAQEKRTAILRQAISNYGFM